MSTTLVRLNISIEARFANDISEAALCDDTIVKGNGQAIADELYILSYIGDLWGPFLLTLLLSITLAMRTNNDASTIITSIFFIMWVGSLVVYLNANFLGS